MSDPEDCRAGTRSVLESIRSFNAQLSSIRAQGGTYDESVPSLTVDGEDCITVSGVFYGPGGLSQYLEGGSYQARTQPAIVAPTAYPRNGPYSNQPYDDRPYTIGPNNGPYNSVPYNNGPYNNGPYNNPRNGPYNQGPYNQGPINQGPYNIAPWRGSPISSFPPRTTPIKPARGSQRSQRTTPVDNRPWTFGGQLPITRTWSSAGVVTVWVDNGQYNSPYRTQTTYVTRPYPSQPYPIQPYPIQPISTYQTYSTYSEYSPQSRPTVYVTQTPVPVTPQGRSTVYVTTTRYASRTSGVPRIPPPVEAPTFVTTQRDPSPPTPGPPVPSLRPESVSTLAPSPVTPKSSFTIVPLSGFSIVPFTGLAKPTAPPTRDVTVPGQRPYRL